MYWYLFNLSLNYISCCSETNHPKVRGLKKTHIDLALSLQGCGALLLVWLSLFVPPPLTPSELHCGVVGLSWDTGPDPAQLYMISC